MFSPAFRIPPSAFKWDGVVQAARSGKQNIAEGSQASGTWEEMEIKLTNVARASLEELLVDYQDFLRTRGFSEWPKEHRYVRRLRELNRTPKPSARPSKMMIPRFARTRSSAL